MITHRDTARQLLRQSDYTISELVTEIGADWHSLYRMIKNELKNGNVEVVSKNAHPKRYTWCGDDDLITMALRAADYLRDNASDELGKSLSRHLFRLAGDQQ